MRRAAVIACVLLAVLALGIGLVRGHGAARPVPAATASPSPARAECDALQAAWDALQAQMDGAGYDSAMTALYAFGQALKPWYADPAVRRVGGDLDAVFTAMTGTDRGAVDLDAETMVGDYALAVYDC